MATGIPSRNSRKSQKQNVIPFWPSVEVHEKYHAIENEFHHDHQRLILELKR